MKTDFIYIHIHAYLHTQVNISPKINFRNSCVQKKNIFTYLDYQPSLKSEHSHLPVKKKKRQNC